MAQQIGLEAVLDLGQFNKGVKDYLSGLDKMNKKTGGFAGSVGKSFQAVGKAALGATAVLAAAGIAAGAAVAKFAVDGISKAKDLEAQISGIAAVIGKTAEQVAPLKDLILDLGLDPTLKVNATEAAAAIEMLARNGLGMQEILDGAAHSTVLLANATGADFGTAADIATDVMAQFNIKAEDMNSAVDGITSVVNNSKFSIDDYRLAIAQGGGVAASVGVSFDDFNTTIAATSSLFGSGSDAGTSYKTFLSRLNPSSKEAAAAMQALGLSFFDANGQMKSGAEISEELNRAFNGQIATVTTVGGRTAEQQQRYEYLGKTIGGLQRKLADYQSGLAGVAQSENDKIVAQDRINRQLVAAQAEYAALGGVQGAVVQGTRTLTEEERNHYATLIFGSDAMRTAFGLADAGAVVYTDLGKAAEETGISQDILNQYIEGGITQYELLQAQMGQTDASDSAKTRMDNLAGAMEILSGIIETIQIKIGEKFLPVIRKMTEVITGFLDSHSDDFIAFFDALAAGIEAAMGVVQVFIQLFQTGELVSAAEFGLSEQTTILADSWVDMTLKAWDTVAAIGAFWQPITDAIGKFVEWKDVLIVLGAAIAAVVIPAIAGLIVAVAPVVAVFAAAVLAVAGVRKAWETDFLGIKTATLDAFDAIKTALTPLTSAIQQFGSGALTEIRDWASGNETEFTNVKAIWEGAKQAASNLFTGITSFAASHLPGWKTKLTEWATEGAAWVQTATTAALGYLAQWVTAITDYVAAQLPAWKAELTKWAIAAWQWIVDTSVAVSGKLQIWLTNLTSFVAGHLPGWKAILLDWAITAWQWIVDAAGFVASKLDVWYTNLKAALDTKLSTWKTTLINWATTAWQWILDAASLVATKLDIWYENLKTALEAKLTTWKTELAKWVTAAWQWILDAAAQLPAKLAQWYTDLKAALDAKLPTWKATLLTWASAAWQWILDAAGLVAGKIGEWYTKLKSALDAKLPTWKTAFTAWATAAWQWILDAGTLLGGKIGTWYTSLKTAVDAKLPTFKTEMLKFATALVTWITDKAANALPALGTWLGKVVAWIPLGVLALATAATKLAGALIGWIAGGNGETESAVSKTDPEMEKFKAALTTGLTKVWEALKIAVQNFAQSFWDTLNEHVDWQALGATIMGKIKLGVISIRQAITDVFSNLATSLYNMMLKTDWLGLGRSLINDIKQGIIDTTQSLLNRIYLLAVAAANKFTSFDWGKLGKAVIDGILKGLKANADQVIEWIKGLAGDLVKKVTDTLGISSPSKVFAEIGRNIIEGWIIGLQQSENGLLRAVNSLTSKVLGVIVRSRVDAVKSLAGALNDITSIGGSYLDSTVADLERVQQAIADNAGDTSAAMGRLIQLRNVDQRAIGNYSAEQRRYEILKQQAELVEYIRSAGGDVGGFLSHITLGDAGNPNSGNILNAIATATKTLNDNLANTLRIAGQGWDKLISDLQAGRKSIEEIEGAVNSRFATQINGLDAYRERVNQIDDEIAQAEDNLLKTGDQAWATRLRSLSAQRQTTTAALEDYLYKTNEIERRLGSITVGGNQRAADAIAEFRSATIDPLIQALGNPDIGAGGRADFNAQIHAKINAVQAYAAGIAEIEAAQKQFNDLFSNTAFSQTIQDNMQSIFDSLYTVSASPAATAIRQQKLRELQTYASQVYNTIKQAGRISGDAPGLERYQTEVLDPLLDRMLDINTTTAQRTQLLFEYTSAVNKAVVVEQKQGKLDQIQSQLDLLQKAKDLSDQLGGRGAFDRIFAGLDPKMALTAEQLATVMARYTDEAIRLANRQIIDIADLATVRDYSVELGRIVDRAISFESVLAEFDSESMTPLDQAQGYLEYYDREIVRLRTLAAEGNQASLSMAQNVMVQRDRIVQYMRTYLDKLYRADLQLDRLQESSNERAQEVADNYREAFIDPLREQIGTSFSTSFQDNAISLLGSRIDKVNAYIASIKQMGDVEADIAAARALNPLMGMLAAERIDPLIERLYDINTTEAQRLQITQQLVAEQQKLVALQEKQQKLDFLQQQLDLFNQIDQLNDQFDDIIPMSKILDGITFGLDASLDDMLELTSRSIDAIITAVKHQLGIASPSKVFAKIGQQTMQGLASGVKSAVSQPLSMMRQAASMMPYAMETRSLSINMGGVSINNGMDERMFTERVRMAVERML